MEEIDITEHNARMRDIDNFNRKYKEYWYNPMEGFLTTIPQSIQLQRLGLDMSDSIIVSYFYVGEDNSRKYHTLFADPLQLAMHNKEDYIHRYTLQEMLDKLPKIIKTREYDYELVVDYGYESISYRNEDETLLSTFFKQRDINYAVYEMLEWLLLKGYKL